MSTEHVTTCRDGDVRGHRGTIASCTCGWRDAWTIQGGNAEASAHMHRLANDPVALAAYRASYAASNSSPQQPRPALVTEVPTPDKQRCHDCSCHIDPPCGRCENCAHWDIDDCPNDCQTCEDHEERS